MRKSKPIAIYEKYRASDRIIKLLKEVVSSSLGKMEGRIISYQRLNILRHKDVP